MARISRRRLARYLAGQLSEGKDHSALLRQVASYLVSHKLTKQAELLIRDVAEILESDHGMVMADVISAGKLSDELINHIQTIVAGGKMDNVQIENSVDPNLIGGVIVKTPSRELDASIRTKLNLLRSV